MEKIITHDQARNRFELERDGHIAYIRYQLFEGGMDIISTQVPPELEGQGIAGALTRCALEYARNNSLKIIATCSYTGVYLKRHPEYQDLEV